MDIRNIRESFLLFLMPENRKVYRNNINKGKKKGEERLQKVRWLIRTVTNAAGS